MLQGSFLGPLENRKSVQNRTCEHRRALWPSKSGDWVWVWKKHQNLIKNRCENRRFLMAQNHVWHYTLRLFHTFAILGKSWKIDAKFYAKRQLFGAKTWALAPTGRLIRWIFEDSKNHWFLDVALGIKNSLKIDPRTDFEALCRERRIVGARPGSPGAAFSRAVSNF